MKPKGKDHFTNEYKTLQYITEIGVTLPQDKFDVKRGSSKYR
jgi:hypothetical protein